MGTTWAGCPWVRSGALVLAAVVTAGRADEPAPPRKDTGREAAASPAKLDPQPPAGTNAAATTAAPVPAPTPESASASASAPASVEAEARALRQETLERLKPEKPAESEA